MSGWRLALVFLLLAVVTHLPSLIRTEALNPDEAYLATEAQVLNDGGRLYHDVVDRKPEQHDFRTTYRPGRKMVAIGG